MGTPDGAGGVVSPLPELPRKRRYLLAVLVATVLMAVLLVFLESRNLWFTSGVTGALILAIGLWAGRKRLRARILVDRRRALVSLAIGVGAGLAMLGATHLGARLLAQWFPRFAPLVADLYDSLQAPPGPLAALPIVALVVLAEEVVWRALLIDVLRPRIGGLLALGIGTALYVLPQVAAGNQALLVAGVTGGLIWGALYLWRHDLLAPFTCHLLWNVGIFVVWPLV